MWTNSIQWISHEDFPSLNIWSQRAFTSIARLSDTHETAMRKTKRASTSIARLSNTCETALRKTKLYWGLYGRVSTNIIYKDFPSINIWKHEVHMDKVDISSITFEDFSSLNTRNQLLLGIHANQRSMILYQGRFWLYHQVKMGTEGTYLCYKSDYWNEV